MNVTETTSVLPQAIAPLFQSFSWTKAILLAIIVPMVIDRVAHYKRTVSLICTKRGNLE